MNEPLQVAIVGAGRMGESRARAAQLARGKVIAVCDQDSTKAKQLSKNLGNGATALTDAKDLPWSNLDAVFVCTPPSARGPVELMAVRAGVSLFVEKPIAVQHGQLKDLFAALSESQSTESPSSLSQATVAVGYMNRHRVQVQDLRKELSSQGDAVLGLSANWVCGKYAVPWWSKASHSGGPVNEQTTHLLDLCRFLIGDVSEVQAIAPDQEHGTCSISLLFQNSAVASLFYSCESNERAIRLQVFSTEKTVHLAGWEFDRIEKDMVTDPPLRSREQRNEIFNFEVDQFFRQLRGEPTDITLCTLEDAHQTQLLVEAVTESLRTGQRIQLSPAG